MQNPLVASLSDDGVPSTSVPSNTTPIYTCESKAKMKGAESLIKYLTGIIECQRVNGIQ